MKFRGKNKMMYKLSIVGRIFCIFMGGIFILGGLLALYSAIVEIRSDGRIEDILGWIVIGIAFIIVGFLVVRVKYGGEGHVGP